MSQQIKLHYESVKQIPFNSYEKDFTFIVNGKTYQTSKFFADLISNKISNYHRNDPTFNEIIIKTNSNGNFQHFLDLLNFDEREIEEKELPFFTKLYFNLNQS